MQMEEAGMTVGKVPVGRSDVAEIGTPIAAGMRQFDGRQRPVGDRPQQLVLGPAMVEDRHWADADAPPKLAHGETGLAQAREQVECRLQDGISVETAPSARAGP